MAMRFFRATGLMALAALALAGAMLAAPAPRAEGDGGSVMNWRSGIAPQSQVRPRRASAPTTTYRARRRYDPPRPALQDDAALGLHMPEIRIALPLPADEARTKIALIGDSLAEALALGFDADTGLRGDFLLRQRTVSASGLVRDDFHNWPRAFAALLNEHHDVAAALVMVGLNDSQIMRIGAETLEPLSPQWRDAYRQRIDAMLAIAREAKVPLVWIGLPVMRLPKLSADAMSINALVRERVSAAGQTFVETMDVFADGAGGFTPTGPDIIGDIVRLRGPDGIHFTPAGQRKLAFFVERPLRRLLGERNAPLIATLPAPEQLLPTSPTIAAPAPVVPSPGDQLTLPAAFPDAAPIPFEKPRPAIGETRALNEIRSANRLAGREAAPPADTASRALFDRGLVPRPREGRSDDFRWR